jgi:hypothetical protein
VDVNQEIMSTIVILFPMITFLPIWLPDQYPLNPPKNKPQKEEVHWADSKTPTTAETVHRLNNNQPGGT